MGNLLSLNYMAVNDNKLSGKIPVDIMRLVNLNDGGSDFRDNHLYTEDKDLKDFLDQKQLGADWESTQMFDSDIPHVEPMALCGGYEPCFASIVEALASNHTSAVIFIAGGNYHENITIGNGPNLELGWNSDFSCDPPAEPVVIYGP